MVSVTSASRYIRSASRYHLRYQRRTSMNICGLIPRNFGELAEAVPIAKSLISKINKCYFFSMKYCYSDLLLEKKHKLYLSHLICCNYACYCVNMVSVTSASRYIRSASRYHLRYQRRSSMKICGLIPRNFGELAEAVPIAVDPKHSIIKGLYFMYFQNQNQQVCLESTDLLCHGLVRVY